MVTTNEIILRGADVVVDDEFLEHYGKLGMKWGKRQTAKIQKRVDRTSRIGSGTASAKDRVLGANRGTFTAKGANRQLQRGANHQAKIAAGKQKVTAFLMGKKGRARLKDLNFHKPGDANAKLDRGQKAAIGILSVAGAIHVATLLSKVG